VVGIVSFSLEDTNCKTAMEPTWGADDGIGVNGSSGNSGVFGTSFGGKGVKKDQMREPKFFDPAPDQLEVVYGRCSHAAKAISFIGSCEACNPRN
jgi:hypothetical protein